MESQVQRESQVPLEYMGRGDLGGANASQQITAQQRLAQEPPQVGAGLVNIAGRVNESAHDAVNQPALNNLVAQSQRRNQFMRGEIPNQPQARNAPIANPHRESIQGQPNPPPANDVNQPVHNPQGQGQQPIQGQGPGQPIQGQGPGQPHVDPHAVDDIHLNPHNVNPTPQDSAKSSFKKTLWKVVDIAIPVLMVVGYMCLVGAAVAAFVPPFGMAASLALVTLCAVSWGSAGLLMMAKDKYGDAAIGNEQKNKENHIENQVNQNEIEHTQLINKQSSLRSRINNPAITAADKVALTTEFNENEGKIETNREGYHNLQTELNSLRNKPTDAATSYVKQTVDSLGGGNQPPVTRDQLNNEIADLRYELEQNTDPTKARDLEAKLNTKKIKLADLIETEIAKLTEKANSNREINLKTSEARLLRMSVLEEEASGLMKDITNSYEQYAAARQPGGLKKEDGTPMPETTRRVIESFEKKLEAASTKINNLDDFNNKEHQYLTDLKKFSPDLDGEIQKRIENGGDLELDKILKWNEELTEIRSNQNIRQAPIPRQEEFALPGLAPRQDLERDEGPPLPPPRGDEPGPQPNLNTGANRVVREQPSRPRQGDGQMDAGNQANFPPLGRIHSNQPRQNIANVNFEAPVSNDQSVANKIRDLKPRLNAEYIRIKKLAKNGNVESGYNVYSQQLADFIKGIDKDAIQELSKYNDILAGEYANALEVALAGKSVNDIPLYYMGRGLFELNNALESYERAAAERPQSQG